MDSIPSEINHRNGSLTGEKAFTICTGGTTGERFATYLRDILIPVYLPSYNPDFNPIEMMWSKMKAILRNWKIRKTEEIQDAVQQALALVAPDDVRHRFAHAGYC